MECNMVGSHVGGVEDTKSMLAFAAEHKILPEVQVIDFTDANQGFEAMRKNNMHFRTVLKIEGFAERHAGGAGSAEREGAGSGRH
jgi:D-arabinose 1-dehydrogenase-like Zn-dependent alcohol dehydrogenase